jgi:hypothetical protein
MDRIHGSSAGLSRPDPIPVQGLLWRPSVPRYEGTLPERRRSDTTMCG